MKRAIFAVIILLFTGVAWAAPPGATIVYQPMTAEGLAAGYPFEAWVYFDKSTDPAVPGYTFPAGDNTAIQISQGPQSSGSTPLWLASWRN